MQTTLNHPAGSFNTPRSAACALDIERVRVRSLPAVKLLSGRFALPVTTAVLVAEAAGFFTGGDR